MSNTAESNENTQPSVEADGTFFRLYLNNNPTDVVGTLVEMVRYTQENFPLARAFPVRLLKRALHSSANVI